MDIVVDKALEEPATRRALKLFMNDVGYTTATFDFTHDKPVLASVLWPIEDVVHIVTTANDVRGEVVDFAMELVCETKRDVVLWREDRFVHIGLPEVTRICTARNHEKRENNLQNHVHDCLWSPNF